MAKHRVINTRFWIDSYISKLSPLEKYFYLYLLTNPYTDISGFYEIPIQYMILETGLEKIKVLSFLDKFKKDHKIFYQDNWIAIVNFIKYQQKNPSVTKGIQKGIAGAPKELVESLLEALPASDRGSYINLNINLNSNINTKGGVEDKSSKDSLLVKNQPFSLSGEIKKLEDSPRRDMNIIALYFDYRKPDLRSYEQYEIALSRHLRAAKKLVSFSDNQLIKAIKIAEKEYKDIYTLETLVKILTK